jgi:hypothetical protein
MKPWQHLQRDNSKSIAGVATCHYRLTLIEKDLRMKAMAGYEIHTFAAKIRRKANNLLKKKKEKKRKIRQRDTDSFQG